MEKTYLQQVLQILNKQEWKLLGDFVASPYFNKNEKFTRFYQNLTPYFPEFNVHEKEKTKLFTQTSKTKHYNDAAYRNLCSDFLIMVQEFIAQEALKDGNTIKEHYLNLFLLQRNLLDLVEKNVKKIETQLTKRQYNIEEQLKAAIWINDIKILHNIYSNRKSLQASDVYMSNDKTHLVITSWALVRIYTSLLNYIKATRSLHLPLDVKRIGTFIELYEALQPFPNPEVEMLYWLLKANTEDDEQHFIKAITVFKLNENRLPNKYMENILIGLLDYANTSVAHNEKWRAELFKLYDLKLNKKLWTGAKGLSYSSLYNAILNALQMGEIVYAKKVLSENIDAIAPNIKTSTLHLCNAWISFFNNDFEQAHQQLVVVETDNLMIKYELRALQSMIYLEKKEWDLLTAFLESFRQFLMYNKSIVDNATSDQFTYFIKHISAIAKLHPSYKQKEKEKIIVALNTNNQSYMRNWMLTKIKRMK